jgi:hypothetical protein
MALPAATASASAQAAPAHPAASHAHLAVSPPAAADNTDPCAPIPAGTFCVGSSHNSAGNCSGTINYITTADFHSRWLRFGQAGVPDHPACIENPTNSTVWLEDEALEATDPGQATDCSDSDFRHFYNVFGQYGWFFVEYNISQGCPTFGGGSEPGGEPDGG